MAELILTEKEKKVATWAELDDTSLGKVVKKAIADMKSASDELNRLFLYSAAIVLCTSTAETNADKFTETIEGLTKKGKALGDWKVTVQRIKHPKEKL